MYKLRKPIPNIKCPNCGYTTNSELLRKYKNHTMYLCTICGTISDVWEE